MSRKSLVQLIEDEAKKRIAFLRHINDLMVRTSSGDMRAIDELKDYIWGDMLKDSNKEQVVWFLRRSLTGWGDRIPIEVRESIEALLVVEEL